MALYVFDTSAFLELFLHFYESRFPTLWDLFDELVANGQIVSVREVMKEIEGYNGESRLTEWVKQHKGIFHEPTVDEIICIRSIFSNPHFRPLVKRKSILDGKPVADPFVVAKAKVTGGIVVTQEKYKRQAAKIPNVCEQFEIDCIDVEGFMAKEDWRF